MISMTSLILIKISLNHNIFKAFQDIFKSIQDIFKSFQDIFNSNQDISKWIRDISKYIFYMNKIGTSFQYSQSLRYNLDMIGQAILNFCLNYTMLLGELQQIQKFPVLHIKNWFQDILKRIRDIFKTFQDISNSNQDISKRIKDISNSFRDIFKC